jgi:hypothetical protein
VLIEGSRTNLLVRSQEFDNGAWSTNGATVTANTIAAPDGTTTADQITTTTTNGYIYPTISALFLAAGGATFVYSVFAKAGTATTITLLLGATANYVGTFNLSTGVASTSSANTTVSMTDAGSGWYRCVLTCAAVASIAYAEAQIGRVASGLTFSLWGAQLEAASFPSSYIPTVAAAATRAADVLSYTAGVSYPLQLWSEFERAVDTGGTGVLVQTDAGTDGNRAVLYVTSVDTFSAYVDASSLAQADVRVSGALAVGTVYKGAGRFSTNNVQAARGGSLGTEDTLVTIPTNPTTLYIGTDRTGQYAFGYHRRIAVIQGAGTDAQLQTVTGS